MDVITVRSAHHPIRHLLGSLLAVAAVLLGIVAMHAMTGSAGSMAVEHLVHPHTHADEASHAASTQGDGNDAVLQIPATDAETMACDEMCQLGCMLLGVACALGVAALMTFMPTRAANPKVTIIRAPRSLTLLASRIILPEPPSLISLSISRT
jgi:hypothetical protein